jgi:hypothetical protein
VAVGIQQTGDAIMILDNATYSRLQAGSVTPKVMDNLRASGRSRWAVRVRGQIIVVGDRLQAVALYDKAFVLGAAPSLLNNGRLCDRSSVFPQS